LGGDAQGDILTGIENLIGSAFNDKLTHRPSTNIGRSSPSRDATGQQSVTQSADWEPDVQI